MCHRCLFDDERDNCPQSVKLLMMRLQRVMAEKMVAAPRKKLLRNWVRAKRNTKAWAANPADFETIVQECIDLGHKEVELQKLDAAKEAERLAALQSRTPADTVLTDAGGSTTAASSEEEEEAVGSKRKAVACLTDPESSGAESEVECEGVSGAPPPRSVWTSRTTAHAFAHLTAHVRARGLPALEVSADEFNSFQLDGARLASCSSGAEAVYASMKSFILFCSLYQFLNSAFLLPLSGYSTSPEMGKIMEKRQLAS